MKISSFKILAIALKSILSVSIISLFCFFAISVKTQKIADDVWKQLGLSVEDANTNIRHSVFQGGLYYYGVKNAKNILGGNRAAVINEMVAYAKKYTNSSDFKAAYKVYRDGMKPKLYDYTPATPESIKAQQKMQLEMNLKAAEEGLNSPNPKIKNGAPARIEAVKKEIAALEDPNNKTIKRLVDDEKRQYDGMVKHNEEEMKKFELRCPEDPQVLIKKRLEEILNITADVDYAAELRETEWKGKKWKVFVNPAYEKKSKEWKLAFRSGKPTTEAVRSAAEKWLKEFK